METDLAPMTRTGRRGKFSDRRDHGRKLFVVRAHLGVEFGQLGRDGLVVDDHQAEPDKGPDDVDAHFCGRFAVKDVGRLNGAMLGEGAGKVLDVLTLF